MSHDDGNSVDLNNRLTAKGETPQDPETSRIRAERNAVGNNFLAKLRQAGQQHRQKLREQSNERER